MIKAIGDFGELIFLGGWITLIILIAVFLILLSSTLLVQFSSLEIPFDLTRSAVEKMGLVLLGSLTSMIVGILMMKYAGVKENNDR